MKINFQYCGEKSIHVPHITFNTLETTLFGIVENRPSFYRVATNMSSNKKDASDICIYTQANYNSRVVSKVGSDTTPKELLRAHFLATECLRRGILPEDKDLAEMITNADYEIK